MKKSLLLLILCGLVFAVSTPTYATFWNTGNYDQNDYWDNNNNDWPDYDWPRGHECTRWCDHNDNPVPEPATAGLALMSLGALGFATRRRK